MSKNQNIPAIEMRGVNVAAMRDATFTVVEGVNWSVAAGEFWVIAGQEHSGKSDLLMLAAGLMSPVAGSYKLFGNDTENFGEAELAERLRVGFVFQGGHLFNQLTIAENVALPLRAMGRAESGYRAEVVELLRWVGLGDRMNASPPVLSGGEKQRAAIARALIVRPELLLADEPTGNVDPGLARRLLRLFVELHRLGTAVVIATHDLQLMDQFGFARRLVVGDGQITIFDGVS